MQIIPQRKHDECYVAVTNMIVNLVSNTSYKQIKNSLQGNSLFDIRICLTTYSIDSCSYKIDSIYDIEFKYLIAHLKNKHYVVLERINGDIYVYDPANYFRFKLNKIYLRKLSNYVLIIKNIANDNSQNKLYIHYKTRLFIYCVLFILILLNIIYLIN